MSGLPLKDYSREGRLFKQRVTQAAVAVALLCGALGFRFFSLQVLEHEHYITLSRDNRVKLQPLPPTRGLIFDRNGVLLAQNLPTHSLEITPELVPDLERTIERLAQLLPIQEEDIARFHRLRQQRRRFDSIPLRVRLTPREVARFSVNRHLFPGADIQAKLLRNYPMGADTAHVLGYVGRINERELQTIDVSNYAGSTHIGKNGVERYYESRLHGTVGVQQVEVNVLGRVIRVLEEQPPIPGSDLYLSIDAGLQKEALEAFGEESGAAVAIDPQNGEVLALVSKPGYDPNLFVEGIPLKTYRALQHSPDKPLFNRALRGSYPPGSTIKPFVGLAGLETGTVGATHRKYCPGFYRLPNHSHRYRDWKKTGHGSTDLSKAIVQSCDVYFYDLAYQLGIDRMHDYLGQFGFGKPTEVDISGELGGLLPSREWKQRSRRAPWYPGETLIVGIGQGYFLATPLQLAHATAVLASGGKRFTPQVAAAERGPLQAAPLAVPPAMQPPVPVAEAEHWRDVIDAMVGVIEAPRGTARHIRSDAYRIGGKTGTAQVFTVGQDEEYEVEKIAKSMRDHALFVAFAPVDKPRIAVAVVVENGGHGGAVAAPIAKVMMDYYLLETAVPDA